MDAGIDLFSAVDRSLRLPMIPGAEATAPAAVAPVPMIVDQRNVPFQQAEAVTQTTTVRVGTGGQASGGHEGSLGLLEGQANSSNAGAPRLGAPDFGGNHKAKAFWNAKHMELFCSG